MQQVLVATRGFNLFLHKNQDEVQTPWPEDWNGLLQGLEPKEHQPAGAFAGVRRWVETLGGGVFLGLVDL